MNEIAALVTDNADCDTTEPKLFHVVPSVEDCHWIFPTLPAANDKSTLVPEQVVKAGDNVLTTDTTAAFETTVWSCNVTIFDVALPHPADTTSLYLVPTAGTVAKLLVIDNVVVVTPE